MLSAEFRGIRFTDADVVNPDDFIPSNDGYNPHRVRPWLIHDRDFTLAVVFASNVQDALDIAADEGKLERWAVSREDEADYGPDEDRLSYLGNASEPFDLESAGIEEIPTPAFSFTLLFEGERALKELREKIAKAEQALRALNVGLHPDTPESIVRDAMIDSGLIWE